MPLTRELSHWDLTLFRAINQGWTSPGLDPVMSFFSDGWTWVAVAGVVLTWLLIRRNRKLLITFCVVGAAMALADSLSFQVLKQLFRRERPCHELQDVRLVQDKCGGDFGLPSNHAANSMAVAVVLLMRHRNRYRFVWLGFALLVGLTRIYLGVHYPFDILLGFVVGATCGLGIQKLAQRWLPS